MLLLVIPFTFKLLVTVSLTNLCTKICKKTIGMELNNKFVTDMFMSIYKQSKFINGAQHTHLQLSLAI